MKYQNMKRDLKGCQYCSGKNLPEWYVFQLIEDVNPNVEILDPYINLTTRMKCRCKIHNVYSNKTVQEILDGKGCIECGKEKLSNYHMFSQKEFEERSLQNNPHIKIRGKYRGNKEKLEVECKKCHNIWNQTAVTLMYGFKLCPFCNGYYGEIAVANFLTGFGFTYEQQYKFEDCKDKRMLPFDFGIKDINGKLICLIEYDGLQHFEPVVVMNMPEERKYEAYEKTVKHDKIKNNYCTQHNIPLIRVPYWEYDNGTLEHFLFDELVKLNLIEEIN